MLGGSKRQNLEVRIDALERENARLEDEINARQQYVILVLAALCKREDNNTIEIPDRELLAATGTVHWWDDRARDCRVVCLKEDAVEPKPAADPAATRVDGTDAGSEPGAADTEPESGDPAPAGHGGQREE